MCLFCWNLRVTIVYCYSKVETLINLDPYDGNDFSGVFTIIPAINYTYFQNPGNESKLASLWFPNEVFAQ